MYRSRGGCWCCPLSVAGWLLAVLTLFVLAPFWLWLFEDPTVENEHLLKVCVCEVVGWVGVGGGGGGGIDMGMVHRHARGTAAWCSLAFWAHGGCVPQLRPNRLRRQLPCSLPHHSHPFRLPVLCHCLLAEGGG